MKYFSDAKDLNEAKKIYREMSKKLHPDHGGDAELFKVMQAEYEAFTSDFMKSSFNKAKNTYNHNVSDFQDILKKIMEFDIEIEIVGFWIYARSSYHVKDQLKEMGFWFSGKHKAWIYSGRPKTKRATRLSMDSIRTIHGSEIIKEKKYISA
jgi:curved DNA-binding protein CbpA